MAPLFAPCFTPSVMASFKASNRLCCFSFKSSSYVAPTAPATAQKSGISICKRLPEPNEVSWSTRISRCTNSGEHRDVLKIYGEMREEQVEPSIYIFVRVLKACSSLEDLETGKKIHAHFMESRDDLHMYVATMLVGMYVKCGSMVDAWRVFDKLPHRDVVSWTAMILGYTKKEECEFALQLYAQMQQEGVAPNERTFVAVLKACSSLATLEEGTEFDGKRIKVGSLEKGRAIQCQVAKGGFDSDLFVGTALVDMYAKCGSMVDACYVFHKLLHVNVVPWTAIILGYAENQHGEVALQLYSRMQQEGVTPNDRTFVGALKACGTLAVVEGGLKADDKPVKLWCLEKGRAIHSQLVNRGFESDVFVGNALMDMYAKCGGVADAVHVFDKLPCRDVVSWSTIILGHVQKQDGEVALQLYARMLQEGVAPNDRTFVGTLKACGSLAVLEAGTGVDGRFVKIGCLEKGRAIHSLVAGSSFESDIFIGNTLIDMYVKCGSILDAWDVFQKLPHCDVVSWNAMILGYAEQEEGEMALQLYAQMQQNGIAPDDRSFVGALKACGSLAAQEEWTEVDGKYLKVWCLEKGRAIHSQLVKRGCDTNAFVGNTLVDMYARCGSMGDARHVFGQLPRVDVVSWNALIAGYAELGDTEQALQLYAQMQGQCVPANSLTFVGILKACGNTAALETGKEIHAQIRRAGLEMCSIVANTLIDMYGKCGSMVDSQELFEALSMRNVVTWSALIAGYTRQGKSELVFHMFERMRQEGLQPDRVIFLSILTVCSHVGLVDEGQKYFEDMSKVYGITPTIEHYNCMVDLLGRGGQVDKALAMAEKMPFPPNLVTWSTLLGACQKWNNVEIGRRAFACAVKLDEKMGAAYVLMSNIYANAHMWDDCDKVEAMRKRASAPKRLAQSWWTDVSGMVHTFVAGDVEHYQSKDIFAKLKHLAIKIGDDRSKMMTSCTTYNI